MGKKGKNTAKKKAAREEAKAAETTDRELKRGFPARLDAVLNQRKETEEQGASATIHLCFLQGTQCKEGRQS